MLKNNVHMELCKMDGIIKDFETKQKLELERIFNAEREECLGEREADPHKTLKIITFIKKESERPRLLDEIIFAADWFEHENVMGRDPRGEADFQAIRLVPLFFECYDALNDKARHSLERFFFERDYTSIYGSENHAIMGRVSRLLSAQFFMNSNKVFKQFGGLDTKEMYKRDREYINVFLDYRVRRGWGEFDSLGYTAEIILILSLLYRYTNDEVLRKKTGMVIDIILLDMICDSYNGLYGGAHGRIYPGNALNNRYSSMFKIYCYYFGSRFGCGEHGAGILAPIVLSDYVPDEIVYKVEKNRKYPYMNREMKHLHSISSWTREEILWEHLNHLENFYINKQTYVDERYMLGAVNHQDDYPNNVVEDIGYAHHQQHEWELTLPHGTNHKIFTHHPGDPGYHKTHNRFTGDLGCLCSTHYTNENTAISIYTITKPNEYPYINAVAPLEIFEKVIYDDKYLFFSYPGLYISLYFSNGYRYNKEDEYKDIEILSDGREHGVVLRVEYNEKFASLEDFAEKIKSIPVMYKPYERYLEFDGIRVEYGNNYENGVKNVYPYGMLYDSPYMKSVWKSGVIHVTDGNSSKIYDFNEI